MIFKKNRKPKIEDFKLKIEDEVVRRLTKQLRAEILPNVKEEINSIWQSQEFKIIMIQEVNKYIKKELEDIKKYVNSSVEAAIGDANFHKFVRARTSQYMEQDFKQIHIEIIDRMLKRFNKDLQRTKELAYSVDTDIKHICMTNSFSEKQEKVIIDYILQKQNNKKYLAE